MQGKKILWVVAITYGIMMWVVSSFGSRRHGFYLFVPSIVVFALCLPAFLRGRRKMLYALYMAACVLTVTALGTEFLLKAYPQLLNGDAANIVYSGYYWQKGGIYIPDLHLGNALRPNLRRSMYWQGHWWTHETNADGYRGRRLERADAIFLGDSMVYGHGIEEDQTVPAQFEKQTGLKAANFGQQGTCMMQSLRLYQTKGLPIRPKYVFVCSHPTDMEDITFWYDPAELNRFLTDRSYFPIVREMYRPKSMWNLPYLWSAYVTAPLQSSGLFGALSKTLRESSNSPSPQQPSKNFVPTKLELDKSFSPSSTPDDQLRWKVHSEALLRIKELCRERGAQLVVFDLGYPDSFSSAVEDLAKQEGIAYSAAGRVALKEALQGRPIYLADDGHWTAEGSKVTAAALADFVAQRNRSTMKTAGTQKY